MEYRYIGDLVNTHGIKGEVRILSDSKFKEEIFKPGNQLYIGKAKEPFEIEKYRVHKFYDMVVFKGFYDINDVLIYKGEPVFINKEELQVDGYFDEDLIGLMVFYNDLFLGKVDSILKSKAHDIFSVIGDKKCLIPYVSEFIDQIDLEKGKIMVHNVEGLIHED